MTNMKDLPILKKKEEILDSLKNNKNLIVVSETGSGKTTQIPQYLYNDGWAESGMIAVTQPRRVAAVTVATRVAQELGVKLGAEVGYSIRFDDSTSEKTKIKYMTDGMLLRDTMNDRLLRSYSVVILDEAHERSLNTDILFSLIKNIQKYRHDLRVIVMSATLSTEIFSTFFKNAPVITLEGRLFDVQHLYLEQNEHDYINAAVISVLQIHTEMSKGHILVFLTGQEEIERTSLVLKKKIKDFPSFCGNMVVYSIYAALPTHEQIKAFEKTEKGVRKVILATNIAETSITIDGVAYVVDCGFSKKKFFDYKTGMDVMVNGRISKSEAIQRSGRAGRQGPGVCYRLYQQEDFDEMEESITPEILRTNLSQLVVTLKSLDIDSISDIDFVTSPNIGSLNKAVRVLKLLGGIDEKSRLTPLGRKISTFPLDPSYSCAIMSSAEHGVISQVLTIVSLLSAENVWVSSFENGSQLSIAKKKFSRNGSIGDVLALLNVFEECKKSSYSSTWCRENCVNKRAIIKALNIRKQLERYVQKHKLNNKYNNTVPGTEDEIRKSLAKGFFIKTAVLQQDKSYRTLFENQHVKIHPLSVLYGKKPECVMFTELVKTKSCYMKNLMMIDKKWLPEVTPNYFTND